MIRFVWLAALTAALLVSASAAQAALLRFEAFLDGPSEEPPVPSPGTGFSEVFVDTVAHTLEIDVSFGDLVGTTTVAHIHAPTAVPFAGTAGVATPVPTFPGFPAGVTAGTYNETFDLTLLSSYNPAFVTAAGGTAADAEALLLSSLLEGRAYLNIHTSFRGGGEIRGFYTAVPEPTAFGLFGIGLVGLVYARRRARG